MRSKESIKKQIESELKKYKYINRHFSNMIYDRIKKDNPTENPLVLLILLENNSDNLNGFNNLIDKIEKNDRNAMDTILSKISVRSKRFDDQLSDIKCELDAYNYLVKKGFNSIEYLKERIGKPTPDIRCEKDGKSYLIEVKSQRQSAKICSILLDKALSFKFKYPRFARDINFSFEHDGFEYTPLYKKDHTEMRKLYRIFHHMVKEKQSNRILKYKVITSSGNISRLIQINRQNNLSFCKIKRLYAQPTTNYFKLQAVQPYFIPILEKSMKAYNQIYNSGFTSDFKRILLDLAYDGNIVLCNKELYPLLEIINRFFTKYDNTFKVELMNPLCST